MAFVGKDGESRGATTLIGGDLSGKVDRLRSKGASTGRAALELRDHRQARARQRLVEGPVFAPAREPRFEIGLGEAGATRLDQVVWTPPETR